MRAALVAIVGALAVLACSERESSSPVPASTVTPTSTPDLSQPFVTPPSAYLSSRSGTPMEGVTGTYCWQLGQRGVCADYSPWITNSQPIPIEAGTALVLTFDAGTPSDIRIRWLPTTSLTPRNHGDVLDWTPSNYQPAPLGTDLRAPVQPGRYALAVQTLFPEGDVTYGFYTEVR